MTPPVEIPPAAELCTLREGLGLSQYELAEILGFKDLDVVRRWETGEHFGKPYAPTPLAWCAFRFILLTVIAYRAMPESQGKIIFGNSLPERLR